MNLTLDRRTLRDLLAGRRCPFLSETDRTRLAGLHARIIIARLRAGLYPAPRPRPRRRRP